MTFSWSCVFCWGKPLLEVQVRKLYLLGSDPIRHLLNVTVMHCLQTSKLGWLQRQSGSCMWPWSSFTKKMNVTGLCCDLLSPRFLVQFFQGWLCCTKNVSGTKLWWQDEWQRSEITSCWVQCGQSVQQQQESPTLEATEAEVREHSHFNSF